MIAPPPPDSDVVQCYEANVGNLAAGMTGWRGDPAILTLTPTAQQEIQKIEATVEPTLAGDGELAPLADWGAKYVGAVARIAGIIHLAEHGAGFGPRKPVEAQTVRAAYSIGAYFKACAITAFSEMGTDHVTTDAAYLLDRIGRLGEDEVSERDLFTASSRARFKTMTDLMPALERLIDHCYLAPMPASKPTGGRPASPRYKVHPLAAEAATRRKVSLLLLSRLLRRPTKPAQNQ